MTTHADLQIGCQTITWGEGQRHNFPEVFRTSAEAGYKGLEIGFRHIQEILPQQLDEMLAEHGLVLVASHVGGNLEDTGQAEGERQMFFENTSIGAVLYMLIGSFMIYACLFWGGPGPIQWRRRY